MIIAVKGPSVDFEAHAWLDGEPDGDVASFAELMRLAPVSPMSPMTLTPLEIASGLILGTFPKSPGCMARRSPHVQRSSAPCSTASPALPAS